MTDNKELADAYSSAIEFISGYVPDLSCSDAGRYTVSVTKKEICKKIFNEFGYDTSERRIRLNLANIREDCCINAFLRGVFLAAGSVTDPEKEYHLEFSIASKNLTDDFMKLFDEYDGRDPDQPINIVPRLSGRNGVNIVYFKDSSTIEDFLTVTGAQNSAMAVMGAKVYKDIKNNVNRRVNFETANINRSVNAAYAQVEAINKIINADKLEQLPDDLKALAQLRFDEREMSLRELGENMNPPLSRTAVNYRLKKIMEYAESI